MKCEDEFFEEKKKGYMKNGSTERENRNQKKKKERKRRIQKGKVDVRNVVVTQ